MKLPKLKRILTDPDEFLSNEQLKSLSMELLELIPLEGIEGSGLDSEEIMEVVLRAAVDTTSVNGVTTNTEDTPNRETVNTLLLLDSGRKSTKSNSELLQVASNECIVEAHILVGILLIGRHGR